MKLNRREIHQRALEVLESHPQGIRWVDLLRAVELGTPETPHNSIHGGIHNLLTTRTSEIVKVARGTYQLAKYVEADNASTTLDEEEISAIPVSAETPGTEPLTEKDFYKSFAEWLQENDEGHNSRSVGWEQPWR